MGIIMQEIDIKLLISGAVLVAGGGVAWGQLRNKVTGLSDRFKQCDNLDIMTSERCREFHDARQETTNTMLDNIQRSLDEMKSDRKRMDARIGGLASQIDRLVGRSEANHGR
jgi:hypothetical protein